jgi:AraC family transcriptional regulator
MATIITPIEVPKFVPGAITAASDDLGWNGVWLRGYRYTGLDVIVPPVWDSQLCRTFGGDVHGTAV